MQDKIRSLEERIAELQEQNAYLYESAATFSQLARLPETGVKGRPETGGRGGSMSPARP